MIALLLLAGVLAQTRPTVSEIFEGDGALFITPKNGRPVAGVGTWAIDQPKGWGVEHYEFPEGDRVWEVQRWDEGVYYSSDRGNCTSGKLTGNMPTNWAWLATATFVGTRRIGEILVNIWSGNSGGVPVEAAFLPGDPYRPIYLRRNQTDATYEYHITVWSTAPPNPEWFIAPPNCKPPPPVPPMKFFNSTAELGCPGWAMYKQCDARWAREILGHSSNTICAAGCAMSSVAMYLTTRGHGYNPSTLNSWLNGHGGYVGGDELVWGSVNSIGVAFQGIENPSEAVIASGLGQCHGIVANVRGGSHWVLLTGHPSAGVFSVNDPGFNEATYSMSSILRVAVYH